MVCLYIDRLRVCASDPTDDIRLGDVVVGWNGDKRQAVIHCESGTILPQPDRRILNMLPKLGSNRDVGKTAFSEHLNFLQELVVWVSLFHACADLVCD